MSDTISILTIMGKICKLVNVGDDCGANLLELLLKICWLGQFEGIPDDLRKGFADNDDTFSNSIDIYSRDYDLPEDFRNVVGTKNEKIQFGSLSPFIKKLNSWKERQTNYYKK